MRKQEPQKKAFINRLFNSKFFWLVVVLSGALFGNKNKLILNVPRHVDLVEFALALLIVTPLLYFQVYKKGFYKKDAGGIWFWLMNVFLVLFIAGITTLPFDYALNLVIEQQSKESPVEYVECHVRRASGRGANISFEFKGRRYRRVVNFRAMGGLKNYDYSKLQDEYVWCVEVRKSILNAYVIESQYLKPKKTVQNQSQ